jgi:hypothetical protein
MQISIVPPPHSSKVPNLPTKNLIDNSQINWQPSVHTGSVILFFKELPSHEGRPEARKIYKKFAFWTPKTAQMNR